MAEAFIALVLLVLLALALERNHRRSAPGADRPGLSPYDRTRIRAELAAAAGRRRSTRSTRSTEVNR
jgi:hypothetical protein